MKRPKRRQRARPKLDRSPYMQLYRAVARYVKSKGGQVVVAGGVQIMQEPGDGDFRYGVVVRVTGRKPTFALDKFAQEPPVGR